MNIAENVRLAFTHRFGQAPAFLVRAPGRVNIIGEHTDYNDGFVLPMAIDMAIWIALRPRPDRLVRVHSLDFETPAEINLDQFSRGDQGWPEYVKGVTWALQQADYRLCGWEGVLGSNVPIGAGLSSSAALDLAIARAYQAVSGWEWDGAQMAVLACKGDNDFVGINTGIMDQMISATGRRDHAMLLDCRSLDRSYAPLPRGTDIVVLDTSTQRGLVDSAYNERVEQCGRAARHFGVAALRDVSMEKFEKASAGLDPVALRRARHVISEDARTLAAVEAMQAGDAVRLGQLMNASHDSLRDDYEVSSHELNAMVETARRHPGCYGARLTGAGFGGCAVALVDSAQLEAFIRHTLLGYAQKTGLEAQVYACRPAQGASLEAG